MMLVGEMTWTVVHASWFYCGQFLRNGIQTCQKLGPLPLLKLVTGANSKFSCGGQHRWREWDWRNAPVPCKRHPPTQGCIKLANYGTIAVKCQRLLTVAGPRCSKDWNLEEWKKDSVGFQVCWVLFLVIQEMSLPCSIGFCMKWIIHIISVGFRLPLT
jgi:hypothetical protein